MLLALLVQEVQWLEFFAGLGNLTTMMRASNYQSLRFDILDHQKDEFRSSNFMDLTHTSGFGFLGFLFSKNMSHFAWFVMFELSV